VAINNWRRGVDAGASGVLASCASLAAGERNV
jgi:hypothetical protein